MTVAGVTVSYGTASDKNGANISIGEINNDGTIKGIFTGAGGWTTQNGRLPGLFGNTVAMPEHLK